MIRLVLTGLLLVAVLSGCQSSKPQLRERNTPDYMVRSYNPESKINVEYYFQRTYLLKKRGENLTAVEYINYNSEVYLPADTVGFVMTVRVKNPKELYLSIWKHLEVETYKAVSFIERNINYQLIYEGRLPTRSYQLTLPVEDNQRYKMFIELKEGGGRNSMILRTFELNYKKEK